MSPIAPSSLTRSVYGALGTRPVGCRAEARVQRLRTALSPVRPSSARRRGPGRGCPGGGAARRPRAARATSSARRATPAAGPAMTASASRWTTSRRSAGASSRRRASSIWTSLVPVERHGDDRVEHIGLVAQDGGEREHVLLRGGMDALERGNELAADPVASVGGGLV